MRHRAQHSDQGQAGSDTAATGTQEVLGVPTSARVPAAGKHRAQFVPEIPTQAQPTHDTDAAARTSNTVVRERGTSVSRPHGTRAVPVQKVPARTVSVRTVPAQPAQPAPVTRHAPAAGLALVDIPDAASWKASHLPRVVAGTMLALAVLGTAGLGVRYAQSRTSDDSVSLVIGLVVVVVLWAVMIATTPQVVHLEHSILTVHNIGGTERFDLADPLQPVDVVGNPRTSHWAVLLHRPHDATVVLRRNDVVATELDPIVRHYRAIAAQRHSDRDARFNR
ncbi:MAG: hypothetical protein JWQ93_2173 [Marmoricola sp.]|nr:hypothetical protein [Marmoricola sp.]